MNFVGEKFDKSNPKRFNRVWICQQIRADLKEAFNKDWKFGVRKEPGNSNSIRITFKKAPEEAINRNGRNGIIYGMLEINKPYMSKIERIVNAYNYDNSDGQIDYFDRNYYVYYDFDLNI